jgi:hypothetical protein
MLQTFSKYAGIIQAILGAAGTASPNLASTLGAAGGGIFNLISALSSGTLDLREPKPGNEREPSGSTA